ncbi:MAG: ATP-binding protein [archaeon GB-1867-035]|nr:ATP-binding protein [Candidatus Culexmicrobium profundum]
MNQQFVDREVELNFLEERYASDEAQFIVIYGKRRIGKTSLILNFLKNKPYIYFLCEKTSIKLNLLKMAKKMAEYLERESFSRITFIDWEDLFREFLEWKSSREKLVIVFDEFPYLIELDRGITSLFQKIWDEHLSKRSDIMLIICGSSIGMMETEILSHKSPLYGRRTGQWKVTELDIRSIWKFIQSYSFEEVLYIYGAIGGTPAYLAKLDDKLSFYENISNLFLSKGGVLYEEAENLLRQELREPRNYKLILNALADGYRRVVEISNITGLDKAAVSRYLDTLQLLEIVDYETPILEKPKTKKRLYHIKDNYFNFWFKYIYPNKDLIEEEKPQIILKQIKEDLPTYMGPIFEKIAKKFLYKTNQTPFQIIKMGRQWWKTKKGEALEIDILGYNKNKKKYIAIDVKWKNLTQNNVKRIINQLKIKTEKLNIKGKIYYGIIAKKIQNKQNLKNEGYLLFDLKDLQKASI